MRVMTRRAGVGLAVVSLCAIVLASRVRTVAGEPRVTVGPRVVQLMDNRLLAVRIGAYARRYGRPAYSLDSVTAHRDSADAAAFRSCLRISSCSSSIDAGRFQIRRRGPPKSSSGKVMTFAYDAVCSSMNWIVSIALGFSASCRALTSA
jgi:hypothetical protein